MLIVEMHKKISIYAQRVGNCYEILHGITTNGAYLSMKTVETLQRGCLFWHTSTPPQSHCLLGPLPALQLGHKVTEPAETTHLSHLSHRLAAGTKTSGHWSVLKNAGTALFLRVSLWLGHLVAVDTETVYCAVPTMSLLFLL